MKWRVIVLKQIRRLSYWGPLRTALARLGLSGLSKRLYFSLFRPSIGWHELIVGSQKCKFVCDTPTMLRFLEALSEKELQTLTTMLDVLKPGDVLYDVGASIGLYSIPASERVGQAGLVVAFEPEMQSYEYLMNNMKLNDVQNVLPMSVALGDTASQAVLSGRFGGFNLLGSGGGPQQKAEVMPGDSLVREKHLPLPVVVKIDVEGYEYSVIQGLGETLKAGLCRRLFVEVHPALLPPEVTSEKVLKLIRELGFTRIQFHDCGDTFHAICFKQDDLCVASARN